MLSIYHAYDLTAICCTERGDRVNWDVIFQYLPLYWDALLLTLYVGWVGVAISIALGLIVALVVHYRIPVLRQVCRIYIEIFRNTPLLIQLFLIFFGIPRLLGTVMSPHVCGAIGLGLLGGSYMAEAFRSGLESVDTIQLESALSLGMTKMQAMRHIILPQAVSLSMPAFVANVIFLLKETSVFSVISLMDLMFTAKDLIAKDAHTFESLFLLVVFYLLMLLPVSIAGSVLERRLRHASFGD